MLAHRKLWNVASQNPSNAVLPGFTTWYEYKIFMGMIQEEGRERLDSADQEYFKIPKDEKILYCLFMALWFAEEYTNQGDLEFEFELSIEV